MFGNACNARRIPDVKQPGNLSGDLQLWPTSVRQDLSESIELVCIGKVNSDLVGRGSGRVGVFLLCVDDQARRKPDCPLRA